MSGQKPKYDVCKCCEHLRDMLDFAFWLLRAYLFALCNSFYVFENVDHFLNESLEPHLMTSVHFVIFSTFNYLVDNITHSNYLKFSSRYLSWMFFTERSRCFRVLSVNFFCILCAVPFVYSRTYFIISYKNSN